MFSYSSRRDCARAQGCIGCVGVWVQESVLPYAHTPRQRSRFGRSDCEVVPAVHQVLPHFWHFVFPITNRQGALAVGVIRPLLFSSCLWRAAGRLCSLCSGICRRAFSSCPFPWLRLRIPTTLKYVANHFHGVHGNLEIGTLTQQWASLLQTLGATNQGVAPCTWRERNMIRRFIGPALILAVLGLGTASAQAQIRVTIDGEPVHFSGFGPREMDGRVLVPLRGVLEQLRSEEH